MSFFRRRRLRADEDFVFTAREHLLKALVEDALRLQSEGRQVLVLAVFAQTLERLQAEFSGKADREGSGPIWCFADPRPSRIVFASADQLPEPGSQAPAGVDVATTILVAERHPSRARDEALSARLSKMPGAKQLRFYVALDDSPFDAFIGPKVIEMFHTLGMQPSERLSSRLVSRSLERVQKKIAKGARSDLPSASAIAWMQVNLKG